MVTIGLFRTVSEINGDFSQKSSIFPTVYFVPPLKGLPLESGIGAGVRKKTSVMGLPDGQKSFKVVLVI